MELTEKVDVGNFQFSFADRKSTLQTRHFHDCYEIDYYLRANIQCFVGDALLDIRDGDILFIRAFDIHKFLYNDAAAYIRYNIHFKKSFIFDLVTWLQLNSVNHLLNESKSFKLTPTLQQRSDIEHLLKLYKKNIDSPSLSQMYLLALLDMVAKIEDTGKSARPESRKDKIVKDIIEYIDQHYARTIHLDELERHFHLSKYYMIRVFKNITQSSITQYLQLRRVVEAQRMLMDSDKPVGEIGYDCGFQNEQHFYRVFKKIVNLTPAKYRIHSQR